MFGLLLLVPVGVLGLVSWIVGRNVGTGAPPVYASAPPAEGMDRYAFVQGGLYAVQVVVPAGAAFDPTGWFDLRDGAPSIVGQDLASPTGPVDRVVFVGQWVSESGSVPLAGSPHFERITRLG